MMQRLPSYPERAHEAASRPNVNLLLGDNGAGKTTILRAVALTALVAILDGSGFVPYRLVRRTKTKALDRASLTASLEFHEQGVGNFVDDPEASQPVTLGIERIRDVEKLNFPVIMRDLWEDMYDDGSPAFLVLGYGASRRVESSGGFDEGVRRRSRLLRYQRVAGLFEDQVTLTPLSAWLPEIKSDNPSRYKQAVKLINQLLPEECVLTGAMDGPDVVFEHRGVSLPFSALSDGYRGYIGWIADLLYHMCMDDQRDSNLDELRGIVLVDEIDLHLHPEWQRVVVPKLSTTLPNLQFILSTHSPIVSGTVEWRNIFVMEPDAEGASRVSQIQEQVHGRSSEQILLSPYFNLVTTRSPDAEDTLSKLAQRAGEGDSKAAVEYLRVLTEGSGADSQPLSKRRR